MSDMHISVKEREAFVDTLTEEEMGDVFKEMCHAHATLKTDDSP